MKRTITFFFSVCLLASTVSAQAYKLNIRQNSGSMLTVPLTEIKRIDVNSDNLAINYLDGKNEIMSINVISWMSFENLTASPQIFSPGIQILPNPAHNFIILTGLSTSTSEVVIYSVTGKAMITTTAIESNKIDISALQPGIYLLRTSTFSSRFIKQ